MPVSLKYVQKQESWHMGCSDPVPTSLRQSQPPMVHQPQTHAARLHAPPPFVRRQH